MIIDTLTNSHLYAAQHPGFAASFELLNKGEILSLPLGRHDVDGDRLYFMIQEYDGKAVSDCKWEAHRRYIDIQYVAEGVEVMGRNLLSAMNSMGAYSSEKDVEFFDGTGDYFHVPAGSFAIFYPDDAHMPCIAPEINPKPIRKIVFKVEL